MIHPQPTHFLKNNKKEKRLCFFKNCTNLFRTLPSQLSQNEVDGIILALTRCQCLQTRMKYARHDHLSTYRLASVGVFT
jgi:hypothetical protein